MKDLLLVFVGGGAGSVFRYCITQWMQGRSLTFPFATLIANGLACVLLGVVLGRLDQQHATDAERLLIATGFCGGLSTFSTFTADTARLGTWTWASLNIMANLLVCFACLWAGRRLVGAA
jgi:fluoride exporter